MRRLAGLAVILVVWEAAVRLLDVSSRLLPAPSAIGLQLSRAPGVIVAATGYTLMSALLGYLAAAAAGVALAVGLAHAPRLERGLLPFFVASQAVPVIAFSAIVILWAGNGPLSKVAIAFYLSFFPVTVSTVKGLQASDPMAVALLRTYGAGAWSILWRLRFPTALPYLFVALRIGTTTALIGAIVGEWFGDNRGIGTLILHALYTEDVVRLWCGIAACAAAGTAFYAVVAALERRLVWWPAPALDP
jgi:NitT/TauT family transport system permease protein